MRDQQSLPGIRRRRVLYVAHPVAGDVPANVARALRWLAWLMAEHPGVCFVAPWIAAIQAGEDDDDPAQRARGLEDDCAVVVKCDGIMLVGGRISAGMACELAVARELGHDVHDLTHLGDEPPDGHVALDATPAEQLAICTTLGLDQIARELGERVRARTADFAAMGHGQVDAARRHIAAIDAMTLPFGIATPTPLTDFVDRVQRGPLQIASDDFDDESTLPDGVTELGMDDLEECQS